LNNFCFQYQLLYTPEGVTSLSRKIHLYSILVFCFPLLTQQTSYEAPRYVVFFNLLSLSLPLFQILSSVPCSQTPSVCVPHVMPETKFHTHTECWIMSQSGCPLLRNVYNKNAYFSGNGVKTSLVSAETNTLTTTASETMKLRDSTGCLLDHPAD
jgi:hypothetical protein